MNNQDVVRYAIKFELDIKCLIEDIKEEVEYRHKISILADEGDPEIEELEEQLVYLENVIDSLGFCIHGRKKWLAMR